MNQGVQALVVVNIVFLLVVSTALGFIAHKVRRIYLKQFEAQRLALLNADNVYSQVEALLALDKDLALKAGLPAMRGWAGSPDFLRHVHRIAAALQPENVVECSSGTSTVVLARTMQINGRGHVYSLEHDPHYAAKTRSELARHGLQQYATVIDAPLRTHRLAGKEWSWYETKELPTAIDLLVIDGPPMTTQSLARYPAVPLLNDRISKVGQVILDDAARPDETEAVARWRSELQFAAVDEFFAEKGIAVLKRISS